MGRDLAGREPDPRILASGVTAIGVAAWVVILVDLP
jgi:hypothetical protein